MRAVLGDWAAGERHQLLIGNQGTGKNKIADRLLQLLGWEREYIQLHRDTSVASLTVNPVLKDGVVVWEDSPLVKAVTQVSASARSARPARAHRCRDDRLFGLLSRARGTMPPGTPKGHCAPGVEVYCTSV